MFPNKRIFWAIVVSASILATGLMYYVLFLNHTSINQIGVCYDSIDGTVSLQMQPGWYKTSAFTRVAYITTLPVRVTIPSDARVMVTKMVRFRPEGVDDFIRLQGFSYFSNIENTFLGYAFADKEYSFLEIIQKPEEENSSDLLPIYRGDKK